MTRGGRFLMCAPAHYGVEYVINPWMAGNVHRVTDVGLFLSLLGQRLGT
ncbi:MAG: hypothetical protein ABSE62_01305 [Chthoniobacteraceae bacterium]|jgi:hypothetical protein